MDGYLVEITSFLFKELTMKISIFTGSYKSFNIKLFFACWILISLNNSLFASNHHDSFKVEVLGEGRNIILIPGLMSDGRVWDVLAQDLAKTHRLHIINIAGFAATPKIEKQSLEKVKQQLFAYIEQQKMIKPVIIGHSLGGFLAFWMASSAPGKIGEIISVDGLPFIGPIFTGTNDSTIESLSLQAKQIQQNYAHMSSQQLTMQTKYGINRQATSTSNQQKVIEMASLSDPETVADMVFTLMSIDLRTEISNIQRPVLLLGAAGAIKSESGKNHAKALYQQQLSKLSDASLVMNNQSRHFIMFDKPEWLITQIELFLKANNLQATK